MKKVACLIYPNFSIYEIAPLTSSLVLSFGVEVEYVASRKDTILSEDGLSCQPTKLIDEVNLHDYSCIILPGMADFIPVLRDKQLIKFLTTLSDKDIVIAAISSAPILLAKAGLLDNKEFTGGI
ncbi:DJ-1/PfpI family protein, partial [Streptococcus merionis]|uniref:DJ-1/PfpI family protein n=1 Tax=Streptococcus merionis TaxID=400065 RepID=UPI0026EF028C